MNKNAIQKYAIWARNELIEQVKQRAYQYGITDKGYGEENAAVIAGRVLLPDEKRQRQSFVALIKENGFKQAVEEVAYTWFNRFVALRYMEVNDFLPTHIRVFSDASGNFNPEILKDVLHLDLPGLDKAKVSELLNANKTEELYRYLLLTQCNALNALLPEMFERMGAYTEMLLPNNILKPDGVLGRLVSDIIPEDTWRDGVQIIGWMYQYYNTEPKQAVFDGLKKNIKITRENIPAATQLFTPDWIVRYMVENSLGRLWLEHCRAESGLTDEYMNASYYGWKYYIEEAEQTPEVAERLRVLRKENAVKSPEDIKFIDPCMGSGHILVYAFDVLMQIYTSEGYSERDAAKLILEKNIYGLDIDKRAWQLASFALMMKARQYNRRIFTQDVHPQVYEPTGYADGEEYGSLAHSEFGMRNEEYLEPKPDRFLSDGQTYNPTYETELNAWNFRRLLAQKYDVVVTNPPYMGSSGISAKMSDFVKKHYPDSKSDLFSCFIERGFELIKHSGFNCVVTMQSWMFLSSFETMRKKILSTRTITTLMHMENMVMGIAFGTAVANMRGKHIQSYKGQYNHVKFSDVDGGAPLVFPPASKRNTTASADNFAKIPGSPVAYWVGAKTIANFLRGISLEEISNPRQGLATGDNGVFLRLWFEVSFTMIGFSIKSIDDFHNSGMRYAPYNKGGDFRKWYGNFENLIKFDKPSYDILATVGNHLPSKQFYFKQSITWSFVSTSYFGVRFSPAGSVFDVGGSSVFPPNDLVYYLTGLMCSKLSTAFMNILNPTINFQVGDVKKIPVIIDKKENVESIVSANISLSRADWDAFETSWDFKRHPLIPLLWRGAAAGGGAVPSRNTQAYHSLPFNPALKDRAKELRKAGNLSEVLLWLQLKGKQINGWDFDRQKIIGNYIVDFYCANVDLVVEIDGSSHDDKQEYDAQRDAYLRGLGLSVLHFTDSDVKRNLEGVVHAIRGFTAPALRATPPKEGNLAAAFAKWEREAEERFDTLKANEEELNRIFIDIYGLQDELTPEVEDKDVTVRRADLGREIRSLISYAVGCMFGRYSLDVEGLAYAGGEWDAGKYKTFIPDSDNILPICDDEYFDDDIVGRFVDFVRVVYGAETLEENLKFIADALGGKGTPREVIRSYFLNDFYKDHCKIYQKRPIYWLFDSGKKNGFKALIYMHRYSRDLLAKLRTDYVHEQQERYRTQLSHIAAALNSATGAERARLLKQQDKLTEQLKETTAFEEKVHHLADQNIEIDLDDGVKHNYAIFSDVLAKI